jgi:hypothetical protein
VPGFLFNKGRGRTEFRRGLLSPGENVYVIGIDTLDFGKILTGYYKQGGNSFGAPALLGTTDNYPLTFITNGTERGRISTNGNWLFNTTNDKGFTAQVNGKLWTVDTIYQDKYINIVPTDVLYGDARINIGSSNNYIVGHSTIGIGSALTVDGGGIPSFAAGFDMTVTAGIGILGTTYKGIAIGGNSLAQTYSIALGGHATTTAKNQFVCGGPDYFGPHPFTTQISDIYFGSGVQRNNVAGAGLAYTIHGSGAYGTDYNGGNLLIAGGKGTGTGTPGSILFYTSMPASSGNTLQTLSEKARIAGNSGNLLLNTVTDAGYKLNVNGTVYIADTLKMPNIISKADTASYKPVVVDANGNVFKMSGWNFPQISRTAVNNTGYTARPSDYVICYTALTAPQTVSLPVASDMNNHILMIKDESGAAGSFNITINVVAGGTIDGASSKVINTNYGVIEVYSNGSQWFTK